MKHQKVSVDVWSMVKTMVGYLAIVILGGVLLRLIIGVIMLPRRFARQRENVERAMKNLQERYPEYFKEAMDDITEEKEEKTEEGAEEKEGEEEEKEGEEEDVKGEVEKKED